MNPYTQLSFLELLQERDFSIFYTSFKELAEEEIPGFSNLYFLTAKEQVPESLAPVLRDKIERFLSENEQGERSLYCSMEGCLIVSLQNCNSRVVGLFTEVDPYFADNVSTGWLESYAANLSRKLLLRKMAGIDLSTGLYNELQFYDALNRLKMKKAVSVLLIEAFPQVRTSNEAMIHTVRSAKSLASCLEGKLPLFYLGHHVFGVVATSVSHENILKLGEKILAVLRAEGFKRLHIGLHFRESGEGNKANNTAYSVVDNARFALQTANKRGPFSLCDYDRLRHPENHPLKKASDGVMKSLSKKWSKYQQFSLLLISPVKEGEEDKLQHLFAEETTIIDGEDVYILISDISPEEAADNIREKLDKVGVNDIRLGVASYPSNGFSKSSTLQSCRRALRHADFLGANGVAVLDGLSFNVSGDIYYSEGDLTAAVREYKAGLTCDKNNVNLLNSLGVAFVDLTKYTQAMECFDRALELDTDNFMALFNAGLVALEKKDESRGLHYFERAYAIRSEFPGVVDDLKYQLGRLYARAERFEESVEMLSAFQKDNGENKFRDRSFGYLGQAYFGLGKKREATVWLQRALQYDEYDSVSMSLLGMVYFEQGEGNDIALSLCEKSVELDETNPLTYLNLATIQYGCGEYERVKKTLKKCLRSKITRREAELLMCRCYLQEKNGRRSRYWLKKLIDYDKPGKEFANQIKKIKEEINGL